MKISDIGKIGPFECLQNEFTDREISTGYTSDLLSDVMANAAEDSALITIQAHKNTVAVSSLAGVSAIIICNNRPIPDDMLNAARNEGIAVFQTKLNQFQATSRIAQKVERSPAS